MVMKHEYKKIKEDEYAGTAQYECQKCGKKEYSEPDRLPDDTSECEEDK